MNLVKKNTIKSGKLFFFGTQLIKNELIETQELELILPSKVRFNHSWEFTHKCSNCNKTINLQHNFDKNCKSFQTVNNINSINYNPSVLKDICVIFPKLICVDVENVTYLNIIDFDYSLDFQRKSSVDLTKYSCKNCGSNYLALIRIGIPLLAEKICHLES